nr:ADP-ribosylation factor GTPase-activating protein 2-like [Oncorhynchus nerka]
MQVGGNANATAFFRQHGCSTNDTTAKYNSRAAQMYREKIRQQANTALSKYGSDVSVGSASTVTQTYHTLCSMYLCNNSPITLHFKPGSQ